MVPLAGSLRTYDNWAHSRTHDKQDCGPRLAHSCKLGLIRFPLVGNRASTPCALDVTSFSLWTLFCFADGLGCFAFMPGVYFQEHPLQLACTAMPMLAFIVAGWLSLPRLAKCDLPAAPKDKQLGFTCRATPQDTFVVADKMDLEETWRSSSFPSTPQPAHLYIEIRLSNHCYLFRVRLVLLQP